MKNRIAKILGLTLAIITIGSTSPAFADAALDSQLFKSIYEGAKLPEIKKLIKQGADPKAVNERGFTTLIAASQDGQLSIVKYLVKLGIDLEAQTNDGATALLEAVKEGHLPVVEYLVSKGANIEAKIHGYTPVQVAYHFEEIPSLRLLIKSGADVNVQNRKGNTILMKAIQLEDLDIVALVLARKANLELKNNEGKTALMLAIEGGNQTIIDALKAAGAKE